MDERPTTSDPADYLSCARALYSELLTPKNTLLIRETLENGLTNSGIGVNPEYLSEAWAFLADILVCDYLNRWNGAGKEQLRQAEDAVERARQLAPDLAFVHYVDGFIQRAKGEHERARGAFVRTLEINPDFVRAYAQLGAQLLYVGRPQEALPLVKKAISLSPAGNPSVGMFYWIIGRALFFTGSYDEAISYLRQSVDIRPNLWYNRLYLVSAYARTGDLKSAEAALNEFNHRFPGYTLVRVAADEQTNPNNNEVVVNGRQKFHEGLLQAGMPAR